MQRSADPVATRLRQVECFGHYALAGERGVAVNKNGQHLSAGTVRLAILQCAAHAADHRRDRLQVRWVMEQHELDFAVAGSLPHRTAQVILEILRSQRGIRSPREKRKESRGWKLENIRDDVQPAAMRHTQHQLFDTLLRGGLDDRLEQRHEALASFEAVLLVLRIRGALVVLEGFGGDERGEHTHGFGVAQSRRPAQRLHPRPQPSLLFLGTHVPALERERTAVARLQASEQLRQRAGCRAASKLDWIRE